MIVVEPERPTGYDRKEWRHWTDDDGDGMDTRQEVLAAESLVLPRVTGGRVSSGYWVSPYDGWWTITPRYFDIDHVVSLAEAHQSGGWAWDAGTRRRYANDMSFAHHLIAVSAGSNRSKGAKDPSQWLPTDTDAVCSYLVWWTTIKVRWKLSMDKTEHHVISKYTDTDCVDTAVDFDPTAVETAPVIEMRPTYKSIPALSAPPPRPADRSGCHPAYDPCLPNRPGDAINCGDLSKSQRPVTVTTPGVDPYKLDRDRNGIACAP